MKYLLIIKTSSRGYSHQYAETPEKLCAILGSTGGIEHFSVVALPDEPVETIKVKGSIQEFDRGYRCAKSWIATGLYSEKLLNSVPNYTGGKSDFDKGWEAACTEAMMNGNTPLPDLSLEGIGVKPVKSLRDEIAIEAMQSFIIGAITNKTSVPEGQIAEDAYAMADVMLKQREL